ncbi:MAG TPA: multiheme c-type cytochrome [Pyrinomonadaceae bacterium]|nr:multiheme c-type cytochrome [Pyrinomonadaceae bacterium]
MLNKIAGVCVVGVLICVFGYAQRGDVFSDWRPNSDTRGVRYVGSKACVECHAGQEQQLHTPMAEALEVAPDCSIVNARGRLTFKNGPYSYEISRQGKSVVYKVSDGAKNVSTPILYCFGQGHVGQTYLFRYNAVLYETRVSYFQKISKLDFTIGHRTSVPTSLEDALGRAIGGDEPQQCFGCHTTGAVQGVQLRLDQLNAGVGCEACHGPGEKHLVAAKAKKLAAKAEKLDALAIFNPGDLGALDLSQSFCGSCHTGFEQAMLQPGQGGINNIRFQPYRMFNSRGHNTNDQRLGCVACHNPHEKLQTDAAYYDPKCLACHLTKRGDEKTTRRNADPCPVSSKQCVTCHMPKVELPGMHATFTDHWIRIARPGDPVPR